MTSKSAENARAVRQMAAKMGMRREAKADLTPIRQRTQYSCMATSVCMALKALGVDCNEEEVNKVMGAKPMRGATWEDAVAAVQHYGFRATLVCPSTVTQLKEWTDAGTPVLIAYNPEGRDWSHASCVFDVVDGVVHVADPNIPDPEQTVRKIPKAEFYGMWSEKWPRYLVRRPAMAVEREITEDGRQVFASRTASIGPSASRVAARWDDRIPEKGDSARHIDDDISGVVIRTRKRSGKLEVEVIWDGQSRSWEDRRDLVVAPKWTRYV